MKTVFVLALFVSATLATEKFYRDQFDEFVSTHNKNYASEVEREMRYKIFKQNVQQIYDHNTKRHSSYTMGINKFTDLTEQEFRSQYLGYINARKPSGSGAATRSRIDMSALPESKDWRDDGAISPVKDQGSCGSCWAFATAESIESYAFLNNGTMEILSPQQITSCTPNPLQCGGSGGCMGSIPQLGFSYINLFGLAKDADYPYTSGNNGATGECNYDTDSSVATCRGYESLPHNDLEAIMNHVATIGPLAVAVDAGRWGGYRGGVFDGCDYADNINLNHAVQLVGYGTDATDGDYWIVRNSWGSSWGEDGFIRLRRESTPVCGTDSTPLMGTACVDDGNDVQTVCGMCGVIFDVSYPVGAILTA